jgi:hypothetical protein
MPSRPLNVDGTTWQVSPSGYITQYDGDEFGVLFVRGSGTSRVVRVSRFSPTGSRAREEALAEMSDAELGTLFRQSQPSNTSPEAGYAK